MKHLYLLALAALICLLTSCRIEPPLKLAEGTDFDIKLFEVETDINVIWNIDPDWRNDWWYGWDEIDVKNWGEIDTYPTPSNYAVRTYYLGLEPGVTWESTSRMTIYDTRFRSRFAYGYHDMIIWSNIDSADGTQVLIVDESDLNSIVATTSPTRLSYALPPISSRAETRNSPEIFYAGYERAFYVSSNPEDYDWYDAERKTWVKNINSNLYPMVYTYLVQVVIYNNNGKIVGITDDAAMSALARSVSIHTGRTSDNDIVVACPMRMKKDMPARDGRKADIFGGKLTTFGLCGMESWRSSRASRYTGSRTDLNNTLMLNVKFNNQTEKTLSYDVTEQMQRQAHGGVITIEIDAGTINPPTPTPGGGGSGFVPTITPPGEDDYEFNM